MKKNWPAFILTLLIITFSVLHILRAQQPQSTAAPNYAASAAYVQGFGGGGYRLSIATGLTLNVGPGTANCEGVIATYAGGTLSMSNTTNYVYLNAGASCVPATSTSASAFTPPNVPIATVVGSGSLITSISDDRTFAYAGGVVSGTTVTVAHGTATLGTSAISSGTCASTVTVSASGVATTDNIMADFNADPTSTTGYEPSSSGMLTIIKFPTSNDVNFDVCNNSGGSITPGAVTLNWRVVR